MKKKTIIWGAGGHGKVILDILLEAKVLIGGFIDDDRTKMHQSVSGYKILGNTDYLEKMKNKGSVQLALGIGNNEIRETIFEKAVALGVAVISAIHPRAVVSPHARLGRGVVVMPGAVINSGAIIEDGVVVNTGATVDHDCYLEAFSHIWPGAHLAGGVRVGRCSYIGTGAAVIQNVTIGKNTMVGAGAVVISAIRDGVTAVGVPARVIKKKHEK